MKIKPIGNRVLVKPIVAEQKMGGIIIPDTIQEKPVTGEVVAVSASVDTITEGQNVFIRKGYGIEVKNEDEKYILLNVDDVLAVIED